MSHVGHKILSRCLFFGFCHTANLEKGNVSVFAHLFLRRAQDDISDLTMSGLKLTPLERGGRRTKDCSQTRSFGFQFCLGKHFSDQRELQFYYLKICFLEYLRISGEIRHSNGPIGYWKKVTIWKEAWIVNVGAVIHDYQGEGTIWSRKCQSWKDCSGAWAQLSTDNDNFCMRSRPYQRETSWPSGLGRFFFLVRLPPLPPGEGFIWQVPLPRTQRKRTPLE